MRSDFGAVTYSEWRDDGFLGLQIDALGDGGVPTMQASHPYGFLSRPHDPSSNGVACSVERRQYGSEHFAWLADDPRSVAWLPRVTKGGSAQYGGGLGRSLTWREIDGETGSVIDYVPVAWGSNGTATKAHKLEMGVDGAGDPVVQIVHADGMVISLFDGGVTIGDSSGACYVDLRGGSIALNGSTKVVGGLDVGGTGGVPVPLHPALAAGLQAFAAAVAAAPVVPADGGAALKVALTAAATALAASCVPTTMLKTL
jgi:hypothetical protein